MIVVSSCPVEMETPKIEIDDDTGASKELWEGLGVKSKDQSKGKETEEDLVSSHVLSIVIC